MKGSGRLQFLDSLRGWAAGYVVLYHTALIPNPALQVPTWARPVVLTGGTGVTLFFVASAFSLCHAARPGQSHGRALSAFAVRRVFRIAPLFYLVLWVSVIRDWLLFSVWHGYGELAANISFVFNLLPGRDSGIVWASWTIGVEVLFYAIFPFLANRASTLAGSVVLLIACLMIAEIWTRLPLRVGLLSSEQGIQTQFSFLRHLPIFALGMVSYRVHERVVALRNHSPQIGLVCLLSAIYLYSCLLSNTMPSFPFYDQYYWQGIVYALVVVGLSMAPSRVFVNSLTLHLGQISYSLYLLHPLVIYSSVPLYRIIQGQGWSVTASFGLCAIYTITVTAMAATLSFAFIEAPVMRFGSYLARRIDSGISGSRQLHSAILPEEDPARS